MSSIGTADIVIVIVIALAAIVGWRKGVVTTVLGIVILVFGIVLGLIFKGQVGALILGSDPLNQSSWDEIVGFLVVFAVVVIIGKFVKRLFEGVIEDMDLSDVDRTWGLAFGVFLGGLLIVVLVIFFEPLILRGNLVADSVLLPYFYDFKDEVEALLYRLIGYI